MFKLSHKILASSLLLASSMSFALPLQPAFASLEQTISAYPDQSLALFIVNLDLSRWQYLISRIDQGIKLQAQAKANQPASDTQEIPDEFGKLIEFLQKDLQFDPVSDGLANLGSHLTLAYHPYANSDGQAMFSLNLRSTERAKALIERLNTSLVKADKKNRIEASRFGSETIYTLRNIFKDSEDDKYQLQFAFAGSNLIGTFGENADILKRMLYTQHVLPQDSHLRLINQPHFKAIQASVADKAAWMYFNVDQMLTFAGGDDEFKELFSQEGGAQFFKDFFGLSTGLGIGFDIDAKGVRIKSFSAPDFKKLSPEQQTYFDALHAKPEHSLDSLVQHMPGQPVFWMMGQNPDPNVPDPSFSKAFMETLGKETGFTEENFYKGFESVFHLDYKQDLQNNLDGRMAFGIFDSGNQSLSTVLMLGIKGGREQILDQITQNKLQLSPQGLDQLTEIFDKPSSEAAPIEPQAREADPKTIRPHLLETWQGTAIYSWDFMQPVRDEIDKEPPEAKIESELENALSRLEEHVIAFGQSHAEMGRPVDAQALIDFLYPDKASSQSDWANPVSKEKGLDKLLTDYKNFKADASLAGKIFYEPIGKINQSESGQSVANFRLYAYSPAGKLITRDENINLTAIRSDLPKVEIPKEENPLRDLKPVFARHGDVWLLAGDIQSLKAALTGQKPENLEQWMQKSKTQNASGVFYLDSERGLQMLKDSFPMLFEELSKEKDLQEVLTGLDAWKSIYNASTHTPKGEESEFWLNIDLDKFDVVKWFSQLDQTSKKTESAEEFIGIPGIKANMHVLQTMIETYGVDWGGIYPEDIESLKREAENSEAGTYWKELQNPIHAESPALQNYSDYVAGPESAGKVFYEAISDAEGIVTSYKIYGADENGNLIQDQDELFYLTNE